MTDHQEELREYIGRWVKFNKDEKANAVQLIINLLADEQSIKPPKCKIITLGPPNVRGFYDTSEDTLYVNSYLLEFTDFKPVFRSLVHLLRYKGQIAEAIEYMDAVERDPNLSNDPKYEHIRQLIKNHENYIYPWGDQKPVDDEKSELFWVSPGRIADWNKL